MSRLTFSIILGRKIVSKLVKNHPRIGFHTATFAETARNTAQILRVTCLSIQKWSPSSPNDSQEGPLWLHFVAHTVHVMAMKLSMTTHNSQITIESTRSISRQAHKRTNTHTHTHTLQLESAHLSSPATVYCLYVLTIESQRLTLLYKLPQESLCTRSNATICLHKCSIPFESAA